VGCTVGDAYRYTIQPVFNNINALRRCHIRRRPARPTDALYELFYDIELPAAAVVTGSGGLQTDRTRRVVRQTHSELTGLSTGSQHQVDFLNVQHDAGIQLQVQCDHLITLSIIHIG